MSLLLARVNGRDPWLESHPARHSHDLQHLATIQSYRFHPFQPLLMLAREVFLGWLTTLRVQYLSLFSQDLRTGCYYKRCGVSFHWDIVITRYAALII